MAAILRVDGKDFDPDRFVADSALAPVQIYRRGEPRQGPGSEGKVHTTSGLNFMLSDAEFDEFDQQVADAIAFIKFHRDELKRLRDFPGIESATLDFGIRRPDLVVQTNTFPSALIRRAGALGWGIELTQFPADTGDDGSFEFLPAAAPPPDDR